ncbi:hypothetical protein J6590_100007, partial [Homalodisca vitripennis]
GHSAECCGKRSRHDCTAFLPGTVAPAGTVQYIEPRLEFRENILLINNIRNLSHNQIFHYF